MKKDLSNEIVNETPAIEQVSEAAQAAVEAEIAKAEPEQVPVEALDKDQMSVTLAEIRSLRGKDHYFPFEFVDGSEVQLRVKGTTRAPRVDVSLVREKQPEQPALPLVEGPSSEEFENMQEELLGAEILIKRLSEDLAAASAKPAEPVKAEEKQPEPAKAEIKILSRKINAAPKNNNSPLAWFNVDVNGIRINYVKLLKSDMADGSLKVSPPSFKGHDGKPKYYVMLHNGLFRELAKVIIAYHVANVPAPVTPTAPPAGAGAPKAEAAFDIAGNAAAINAAIHGTATEVLGHPVAAINTTKKEVLRYVNIGDIRFLQQSPLSGSSWAAMANQGKKVTAVYRKINPAKAEFWPGNSQWIGAIVDGTFRK